MTIRYQQKSDTYPYASPTTPGLYVTFRAYLIELICLNVNRKLIPRFWSDQKYWGPKFRREVKGVDNVAQELDFKDNLIQTALINVIKDYNIKALTHKTTLNRVIIGVRKKRKELEIQRANLSQKPTPIKINIKKNSTFIDTGDKSPLAKIREAEHG